MGMHRDGDRWNLPRDVAEERRKVFWECNAADTFQAHCFSRPYVPVLGYLSVVGEAKAWQIRYQSRALRYGVSL